MSEPRAILHPAKPRKPRFKACEVCSDQYEVRRLGQRVCGDYRCAVDLGKIIAQAARLKKARKERREYRAKTKTIGKLLQEAQKEFNRWILQRDYGKPCISCGRSTGAKVNAGHYRTTAAAGHLRFDERQVNLQCEHCNTYLSGNQVEYRKALVLLHGSAVVEEIDNANGAVKWDREELVQIRRKYLGLWKSLRAAREAKNES